MSSRRAPRKVVVLDLASLERVAGGEDEYGGGDSFNYDIPAPEPVQPDFSDLQTPAEQPTYSQEDHTAQAQANQQALAGYEDAASPGASTPQYGADNNYGLSTPDYPTAAPQFSEQDLAGAGPGYTDDQLAQNRADMFGGNGFQDGASPEAWNNASQDNFGIPRPEVATPDFSDLQTGTPREYTPEEHRQQADWNRSALAGFDDGASGSPGHVPGVGVPVPRDLSETFLRGERPGMTPERAFADGFTPRGTIDDLRLHVTENGARTNFVSTTTSPEVARDFALSNGDRANGYIYEVRAPGAIDAARATGGAAHTIPQQEFSFRGGIAPENIVGATPINRTTGPGEFIPNPAYQAPVSNTARFAGGSVAGIAAYEAANLALPYAQAGVNQLDAAGYTGTAAAIREAGNVAGDFLSGAAPVATGVTRGLEYLGVPERYANWGGIVADTAVRLSPAGLVYNPLSLATGVANAGLGAAQRHGTGGTVDPAPELGTPLYAFGA